MHDNIICAIEDVSQSSTAATPGPTVYVNRTEVTLENFSRIRCSDNDILFVMSYFSYACRTLLTGAHNVYMAVNAPDEYAPCSFPHFNSF
jgi:hypothetical protein